MNKLDINTKLRVAFDEVGVLDAARRDLVKLLYYSPSLRSKDAVKILIGDIDERRYNLVKELTDQIGDSDDQAN